jgi:hypothetical protein
MRDTIDMAREIAAEYSKSERFQTWTHDFMMQRLMELVAVSAAAEREACAKVCAELVPDMSRTANDASVWDVATFDCAEAIRARLKDEK